MRLRPIFALLALPLTGALFAGARQPDAVDTVPYCYYPTPLAASSPVGTYSSVGGFDIATDGRDYAVLWAEYDSPTVMMFRKFYADGTPASAALTLATYGGDYMYNASLIWNGTEYAAVWQGVYNGVDQIFFARMSATGALLSGPTRVSYYGLTPTTSADAPRVAYGGGQYAVVWTDNRNSASTGSDIYGTLLTASGAIAGSGAWHDIRISTGTGGDTNVDIAYRAGAGTGFMAVWQYSVGGVIRSAYLNANGTSNAEGTLITPPAGYTSFPRIVSNGSSFGLAWSDTRDGGHEEAYFVRVTDYGYLVSPVQRLTNDTDYTYVTDIVWTGSDYLVIYYSTADWYTYVYDTWVARVNQFGTAATPQRLTGSGSNAYPYAAFGQLGGMIVTTSYCYYDCGPLMLTPFNCSSYTAYAPSCPANPDAYSISGSAATLSWLPASDPYNDIAYYRVYRDNTLVGTTDAAVFTDGGLSTSTTYNYVLHAVNAAQVESSSCPPLYVKTNSSLTLTLAKANFDAGLNWTDAGYSQYQVFRGTSPQVMSQVGATPALTTTDPNALADGVSYFYSVDNPNP